MTDKTDAKTKTNDTILKKRPTLHEVLPKVGLVYSEKGNLSEILCKPKIMPIKSMTLQKIEEMDREAKKRAQAQQQQQQRLLSSHDDDGRNHLFLLIERWSMSRRVILLFLIIILSYRVPSCVFKNVHLARLIAVLLADLS
eukprot:TRINITY_DN1538_c0_g1_i3.p1 TRINITY_DN1538_c0_g1~~TRINITY_DN1538_c0_g1_i3.p1  ORF type:complete len:141 (-),score=21.67 TRINITY_DN1538_c0_g1_i3:253-675(-)